MLPALQLESRLNYASDLLQPVAFLNNGGQDDQDTETVAPAIKDTRLFA